MSSRPSRGAARLAAILDALPDALVLVNANGTVVNANTIALEAFETPGTALVGRGLLDLLPQFDSKLIPGSMRRPEHLDPHARTKPTRMIARRTDGTEFPVEVTSANLENGQQAYDGYGYTGDELLMLVVRDLSGTVDTEAELARSQRQTEMILRAAAEGVVGTDTDGRIVLVNPAAAQILGFRASDLGGRELHDLVLHSRADGSPFPYEDSPLADTLRSGRKHRVRGQVLYSKDGGKVPVDLTTAPVRDGDQLVGAVMTFTDRRPYDAVVEEKEAAEKRHAEELERIAEEHASELTALRQQHVTELEELTERHAEELAANEDRYAALGEREKDRFEALAARHEQLLTLLGRSLRGPLEELRRELAALAADDAGQLWPEANQVLHHLSAGYSRITTLIDNVLGYQRLDTGSESVSRTKVMLDAVVAAGVDGAVELIGPGRVQFAVHAPPIEAEVDPRLLATALAHLVADVAGVDATGNTPVSAGGYLDNTVVVAAAQRGEVVRIEVRGPYAGGDTVHEPIVRGIVRAHGGVLQTHDVPGMSGSAYVLEVPIGGGAGAVAAQPVDESAALALVEPADQTSGGGRRRARRSTTDAFLDGDVPDGAGDGAGGPGADAPGGTAADGAVPTGRRRRRAGGEQAALPAQASGEDSASGGTGRRRRAAENAGADGVGSAVQGVAEGAVVTAAEHAAGAAASNTGLGGTVPPQGVPGPSGRRARREPGEQAALPPALPAARSGGEAAASADADQGQAQQPTGRRRRALAAANERAAAAQEAAAGPRPVFALPPAEADQTPAQAQAQAQAQAPAHQEAPAGQGQQVAGGPGGPAGAPGVVPPPGQGSVALPGAAVPGAAAAGAGAVGAGAVEEGRHDAVPHDQSADHTPPQPHPTSAPTGRRRRAVAAPQQAEATETAGARVPGSADQVGPVPQGAAPAAGPVPPGAAPAAGPVPAGSGRPGRVPAASVPAASVPAGPAQAVPTGPAQGVPAQGVPAQQDATGQVPSAQAGPGHGGPIQAGVAGSPIAPGAAVPPQGVPVAAQGNTVPPQGNPGIAPQVSAPQGVGPQGVSVPAQGGLGQSVRAALPGQGFQPPAPAQPLPPQGIAAPGQQQSAGRPLPAEAAPGQGTPPQGMPAQDPNAQSVNAPGTPPPGGTPAAQPWPAADETSGAGAAHPVPPNGTPPRAAQQHTPAPGTPLPPEGVPRAAQPLPAEAAAPPVDPNSTQGRAISVRTLGQGVPFTRQAAQVQQPPAMPAPQSVPQSVPQQSATPPPHQPGGSGRRRKLGTPPDPATRTDQTARPEQGQSRPADQAPRPEQGARPHPGSEHTPPPVAAQIPAPATAPPPAQPSLAGQSRLAQLTEGGGRSYAIGAPDENAAEGPEPLDGPGGAVEVADPPRPQPMDDELPPEPLDNPRRLLVWPAPDVSTQQALSDRGYRPVIVHSREEVDAQIAAFPAALFVDPLTGPITRTALQSLRQAAVAAEVPVLVTAGLGQASRDAAYGADPAVLLKALAPRDSEQHPPRVLLIEEHAEIALALTATLERRGMQVARAASDADAVTLAGQFRPNLVVMDLLQVQRRQEGFAGIVDWLRANGQLNRTPLVVYTAAVDQADLPRLASGETVLFLAERSTSNEVQSRIVDLLSRIGTN
ncbi:PAS domain S-box-containing protein [Streptomyces sp. Ag82_O1-12]|uniref:PAS domain-containing protein n=1 Tax=unclassified Streptomyces TaxID=2593676 RepID=UPI000BCF7C34|nr:MULTISPECIES: PAS domain-containing protein [unclassified Streptomyces]SMQ17448.1 PAS domain S-box-containing protein [Streptomyces sp. Ag82_O1-12]SOD46482.1 PAS domain S-box-containing protein [Streptomyces sp. Ag82_G6-1]